MRNAEAVTALGRAIGLDLALGRDGACDLVVNDSCETTIAGDPSGTTLTVTALICDRSAAEGILPRLLEANATPDRLGGGAFALDAHTSEVVLVRQIDVEAMSAEALCEALQSFSRMTLAWQEHLPGLAQASDEANRGLQASGGSEVLLRI